MILVKTNHHFQGWGRHRYHHPNIDTIILMAVEGWKPWVRINDPEYQVVMGIL
jgi:hypothetical protein